MSVQDEDDDAKERRISQVSSFSEQSIPLPGSRRLSLSSLHSAHSAAPPAKERRISMVSTTSQMSLALPGDISFGDSDSDVPLPSEASVHSRQPTPTIEALQEDFEDDESSVPQSDADYDDRESIPESNGSVPQSDLEESVVESESESPESSEDDEEDDDDEESDVAEMFDPRFASPALSTREADTLTPTAHLFGTGTPTHGVFGMRTPSRNLVDGRPSPLPESASESWLDDDSPPHSPPPPPPDSPPPSPPPAPPQPPPEMIPKEAAPSPSVVPSQSPSVQSSVPSDIHRPISAQSQSPEYQEQNQDLRIRIPSSSSPGFSDGPSPAPSFGSANDSLLLPSGQSSRSVTPEFGSTLGSLGALTLSQTAFGSTMGLDTDIELPDLSYVHPGKLLLL